MEYINQSQLKSPTPSRQYLIVSMSGVTGLSDMNVWSVAFFTIERGYITGVRYIQRLTTCVISSCKSRYLVVTELIIMPNPIAIIASSIISSGKARAPQVIRIVAAPDKE